MADEEWPGQAAYRKRQQEFEDLINAYEEADQAEYEAFMNETDD